MKVLVNPEALEALPDFLIPQLIQVFASTTPPMLQELQQQLMAHDAHAFGQTAHKLKGSCVSLGANAMAEVCATLQYKGEQQDLSQAPVLLKQLQQLYPATLDALQATAPA
jgi:hypothetical protein